ncbi:MAG: hypothetical protein Q7R81_01350 [Candidatus Peregrinibacteria bacterium]|nr:hypothetical protein [Candidatus Peregrinibacteria bacterium]
MTPEVEAILAKADDQEVDLDIRCDFSTQQLLDEDQTVRLKHERREVRKAVVRELTKMREQYGRSIVFKNIQLPPLPKAVMEVMADQLAKRTTDKIIPKVKTHEVVAMTTRSVLHAEVRHLLSEQLIERSTSSGTTPPFPPLPSRN